MIVGIETDSTGLIHPFRLRPAGEAAGRGIVSCNSWQNDSRPTRPAAPRRAGRWAEPLIPKVSCPRGGNASAGHSWNTAGRHGSLPADRSGCAARPGGAARDRPARPPRERTLLARAAEPRDLATRWQDPMPSEAVPARPRDCTGPWYPGQEPAAGREASKNSGADTRRCTQIHADGPESGRRRHGQDRKFQPGGSRGCGGPGPSAWISVHLLESASKCLLALPPAALCRRDRAAAATRGRQNPMHRGPRRQTAATPPPASLTRPRCWAVRRLMAGCAQDRRHAARGENRR
jgi:hypothetical protein